MKIHKSNRDGYLRCEKNGITMKTFYMYPKYHLCIIQGFAKGLCNEVSEIICKINLSK